MNFTEGKLSYFGTKFFANAEDMMLNIADILLNSSPPSAAYMQWTGSPLAQVMACRLSGAKPLPEPMLAYCQLDSREYISVKFESEYYYFHSKKSIWKCRQENGGHFVSASVC